MKNLHFILSLLFSVFLVQNLLAQGAAPRPTLSTDNATVLNKLNNDMTLNRFVNASAWYGNLDYLSNNEYDFEVALRDTTIHVHSKIYVDIPLRKSYMIYVDPRAAKNDPRRKLKVYPTETVKVSRKDVNTTIVGMPTDSCWLFKVVTGKVNLYSQLSQTKSLNNEYIKAYQVGDSGPILKLDSAALADIVRNDAKAYKMVTRSDYYKAVLKYNGVSN